MKGAGFARPAPAERQSSDASGMFDASAWLAAWAENGGIVILVGDRLYLRRMSPIDRAAGMMLDALRGQMLRAGGGPAIAAELARRREGTI